MILLAAFAISREEYVPLLALILIGGYAFFYASHPVVAVLAYAASRPIVDAFVYVHVGPLSAGQIWGGGLIIVLTVFLVQNPWPLNAKRSVAVPLVFIGAYCAFALTRANASLGLLYALRLTSWILLALAVERIALTSSGQRRVFKAGYVAAIAVVIVIAIAIHSNRYGSAYYTQEFVELGQQPATLAEFAVLSLPFAMLALFRRRNRVISWMLAGLLSIAVILSFSRTAFVALALLVNAFVLIGLRGRKGSVVAAGVMMAAAVTALVIARANDIASRVSDLAYLTQSGYQSRAGSSRLSYWYAVWDGTIDSTQALLVGRGARAGQELVSSAGRGWYWSHNDFLEFFAEGGFPLLLCYVALLVWMFRSMWLLYSDQRQSQLVREFGALCVVTVIAFTLMSFLSGLVFSSAASLMMGMLLGLARGMSKTPQQSFLDEDAPAKQVIIADASPLRLGEPSPGAH